MEDTNPNEYQNRQNRRHRFLNHSKQGFFYIQDEVSILVPDFVCSECKLNQNTFKYFVLKRFGESFVSYKIICGTEIFSLSRYAGLIYDNNSFLFQNLGTKNLEFINPEVFLENFKKVFNSESNRISIEFQ